MLIDVPKWNSLGAAHTPLAVALASPQQDPTWGRVARNATALRILPPRQSLPRLSGCEMTILFPYEGEKD